MTKNQKILLIDANSFIHRAFHALPPLKTEDDKPVGAIYGLTNTLLKILEDENPDYVAAAFDTPQKTFRREMFKEYKAQRPEAPDELKDQIIEAHTLFEKFGIKTLEKPGFEADDILGTLATQFTEIENTETVILTGDLDILQITKDKEVTVLVPQKGVSKLNRYDETKVKERFDLPPRRLADYKALVGDSSDNIPGISGIGPKTARKLLTTYNTLENLYQNIDKEKENSFYKKIVNNKDQAFLSKKLATIKKDVALNTSLENLKYKNDKRNLMQYLNSLGFQSLVNRIKSKPNEELL